jgi:hypothetical protein
LESFGRFLWGEVPCTEADDGVHKEGFTVIVGFKIRTVIKRAKVGCKVSGKEELKATPHSFAAHDSIAHIRAAGGS